MRLGSADLQGRGTAASPEGAEGGASPRPTGTPAGVPLKNVKKQLIRERKLVP